MNPISSRLLNQQVVCPQFNTPAEVVSWMGAMQAQDYRAMRWAVEMRTRKPSFETFESFRKGCAHLLPPYDEYLIAYKSRAIVLDPKYSHRAHNNSGIFRPVIAIDGEIVGNWSMTSKDGGINIFKDNLIIPEDSPLHRQLADQSRTFRTLRSSRQ